VNCHDDSQDELHAGGVTSQGAESAVVQIELDSLLIDVLPIRAVKKNLPGENSLILVGLRIPDENPVGCIAGLHFFDCHDFVSVYEDFAE